MIDIEYNRTCCSVAWTKSQLNIKRGETDGKKIGIDTKILTGLTRVRERQGGTEGEKYDGNLFIVKFDFKVHVIWLYNMLSFWRSLARKNHLAWQKYERSIHKNCHQDDISLNHLPLCIFYAHFKSSWSPPTLQYEFESCRYPNLPSTYLG